MATVVEVIAAVGQRVAPGRQSAMVSVMVLAFLVAVATGFLVWVVGSDARTRRLSKLISARQVTHPGGRGADGQGRQ